MKSGDHQLRLVVFHIIYKVLYIPSGAGFLPSTVFPVQILQAMEAKKDIARDSEDYVFLITPSQQSAVSISFLSWDGKSKKLRMFFGSVSFDETFRKHFLETTGSP